MANVPASGNSAQTQHATLTANVADAVTLDAAYRSVTVQNWDTATPLYFTLDRGVTNAAPATAVIGGAGTFRVAPGSAWEVPDDGWVQNANPTVVSVIAATAVSYTVSGTQAATV